jgi:hypothetical protein
MAEIEKSVAAAVGYRLRGGALVEQAGMIKTQAAPSAKPKAASTTSSKTSSTPPAPSTTKSPKQPPSTI